MDDVKCLVCGLSHKIDKYGWVDSCIGYFQLADIDNEIIKFLKKRR